jgi:hypothetical protein
MGLNGLWPKDLCRRHGKVGIAGGAVRHIELLLLNGKDHRWWGRITGLWSMDDLYNAVTEHAAKERAKAKRWIQRLIDRLQRGEN